MQYTSTQVAAMMGKSQIAIQKLSQRYGIGTKIGRDWLYSEEDVETLRNWRKPGRPKAQKPTE